MSPVSDYISRIGSPCSVFELSFYLDLTYDQVIEIASRDPDLVCGQYTIKSSVHKQRFPQIASSEKQLGIAYVLDTPHSSVVLIYDKFAGPRLIAPTEENYNSLAADHVFINCSTSIIPPHCPIIGSLPDLTMIRRDPIQNIPFYMNDFIEIPKPASIDSYPLHLFTSNFEQPQSAFALRSKLTKSVFPITLDYKQGSFFVFNGNLRGQDCKGRFINLANQHRIAFQFNRSSIGPSHALVHSTSLKYIVYGEEQISVGTARSTKHSDDIACEQALAYLACTYGIQTPQLKSQVCAILAEQAFGILPKEYSTTSFNRTTFVLTICDSRFVGVAQTADSARDQAYFNLSLKLHPIIEHIREKFKPSKVK